MQYETKHSENLTVTITNIENEQNDNYVPRTIETHFSLMRTCTTFEKSTRVVQTQAEEKGKSESSFYYFSPFRCRRLIIMDSTRRIEKQFHEQN